MEAKRENPELITNFAATHDPCLRDELIVGYLPLVHFVLGRLGLSLGMGADYEDAASQGLLGLIEAVDRYDPRYGTQFSTYATIRIRGKVIDHFRSLDWLSRSARQRARQVQNGMAELWDKLQRAPSDEELAKYLELDLVKLRQALQDNNWVLVSLDSVVSGQGEEETCLHELLPDEGQVQPAEAFEEGELKCRLATALMALNKRERLVLSLYYYDEMTFKEIGAILEVSESRVCQLHSRAVSSLKGLLAAGSLDPTRQAPVSEEKGDGRTASYRSTVQAGTGAVHFH